MNPKRINADEPQTRSLADCHSLGHHAECTTSSTSSTKQYTTYSAENFYPYSDSCGGAQNVIRITEKVSCTKVTCFTDGNNTVRTECHSDYMEDIRLSFGDEYIVQTVYKDSDCTTFNYAIGYRVTDTCAHGYYESKYLHRYFYYVARLDDDGSARIEFFSDSECNSPYFFSIDEYIAGDITTKYVTNNDNCVMDFTSNVFPGYYQWYTSERDDNKMSDELLACIIGSCIVLVLIIAACIIIYQERKHGVEPRDNSLVVTVTLDTVMDANDILHYEQPDESSHDGVQFATLVENMSSD